MEDAMDAESNRLRTPIELALSANRAVLDATAETVRRSAVLNQRFESYWFRAVAVTAPLSRRPVWGDP